MLTAAEEKIIHDKVEAMRPLIAAEMTLKARISSVHAAEEFTDNQQRVCLKFIGQRETITLINRSGWQLGQEVEVVFRPIGPEESIAASVKKNGF